MWFDPGLTGLFITSTLLHLGEDINLLVVSASIHLVYVRIPDKGITLHRLIWGDDDGTGEIGIGNVISKNDHVRSHKVWNEG